MNTPLSGLTRRIRSAIIWIAATLTLFAAAPAHAQGPWTTSTVACGLLPASEQAEHGQFVSGLSADSGLIESAWEPAKAIPFNCSWGGFPNVVTTSNSVLSFQANAYSNFNGPYQNGYSLFLIGETGATSPIVQESAPYSGTFKLVLPAGTNLSKIFIQASVYAGTGENGNQGGPLSTFSIGNILITAE